MSDTPATTTDTFIVKITHTGKPGDFANILAPYLMAADFPFLGDYGPDAWGGYEGPFALSVEVVPS